MPSNQGAASPDLSVTFLEDGRQTAGQVADLLVAFCRAATSSLDIAIYDCALKGDAATEVGSALRACSARGVRVRLAYYGGPHRSPIVPPPRTDSEAFLAPLGLDVQPVRGYQALMHHKYVVRDAGGPQGAVWTGSTNWTVDSWEREENVILQLPSAPLAALYRADFEELWRTGRIEDTGARDGGTAALLYRQQPAATRVWFSPGQGEAMAHVVADAISRARRSVVLATPVLTVGSILGSLRDLVHAGAVPVRGVYDLTQMNEVRQQWSADPRAAWKIDAFAGIARLANLAGKRSTPYAPGTVHDYMHAKIMVVDDTVFAGSYNFSHSGEENAENLLRFDSPALAERCTAYIDQLIARYRAVSSSV